MCNKEGKPEGKPETTMVENTEIVRTNCSFNEFMKGYNEMLSRVNNHKLDQIKKD